MLEELTVVRSMSEASLLDRMEPPFTPATFTLWRNVAIARLRKQVLADERYRDCTEKLMDRFTRKVDI